LGLCSAIILLPIGDAWPLIGAKAIRLTIIVAASRKVFLLLAIGHYRGRVTLALLIEARSDQYDTENQSASAKNGRDDVRRAFRALKFQIPDPRHFLGLLEPRERPEQLTRSSTTTGSGKPTILATRWVLSESSASA
jgi:hypothetical protein